MDSRDPESRLAEESTPFLDPTTDDHDRPQEDAPKPKQPVPINPVIFFIQFPIALGLAVGTLAFIIAETLLEARGHSLYEYRDWTIDSFRVAIFWGAPISIVAHVANIIHLGKTRKPLPVLINFFVILALALTFLCATEVVLDERRYSMPDYCTPRLRYPNYPGEPYPDPDSPLTDPETKQECLKWASKLEAITQIVILLAGFHGIILAAIFVTVLVQLYRYKLADVWPKSIGSSISPGGLSFEISLRWGVPQNDNSIQLRTPQPQSLIDQQ